MQTTYPIEQEFYKVLNIMLGSPVDDLRVKNNGGLVTIDVDCNFGTNSWGTMPEDPVAALEQAFAKSGFIENKTFPHGEDSPPYLQFEIPDTLDSIQELKRIQLEQVQKRCVAMLGSLERVNGYIESVFAGDPNQISRVRDNLSAHITQELDFEPGAVRAR